MIKLKIKKDKKNVLITGASGHLGSCLLDNFFKKNYSIFVLDRLVPAKRIKNVKYLVADISDRNQLEKYKKIFKKIDVCIHLAAFVPKDNISDNPERSLSVNVIGSINIADLLKKGSLFIYSNTCEVYNLSTFYAASKLSAEKYLQVVCKEKNIIFISLRFASIYGPGEIIQRAIPNFIKSAIGNKNITIFGDGKEKRSYLYIEDAVHAITGAISYDENNIFDVSSGEVVNILELARLIKKVAGSKSKIIFKPRIKEKKDLFFNIKAAERCLRFNPKTKLAEGLKKEIEYFKKTDESIVFFDLDGTIFDVSERTYRVYKDILQKYGKKFFNKKDYLKLKKEKSPIKNILDKTGAKDISLIYDKEWEKLIETPHYLKFDKLSERTKSALLLFKEEHRLFLITFRANKKFLHAQLKQHKIDKIFEKIIICSKNIKIPDWKIKSEILKKYKEGDNSIIIGDTEVDILAGKDAKIKTIAVVDKMRSEDFLKKYKPDNLVTNIINCFI